MTSLALDVHLDPYRITKPMRLDVARRLRRRNVRRARSDNFHESRRYETRFGKMGEMPRKSGPKGPAFAKATARDIEGDFDGLEEDDRPQRLVIGYSRCASKWRDTRRRADLREIEARHRVILSGIEQELRDRCAAQGYPGKAEVLQAQIAWLESELALKQTPAERDVLQGNLIERELELMELEVLVPYAA